MGISTTTVPVDREQALVRDLRAFIACAFDTEDVDAIYDDAILQVLEDANIEPLRVDRTEHNDDIDDKIVALMEQCDFAIADLTYARPSVYYEAGFVSGRNKPVIYTVRSDHLTPSDEFGNLKVHFDLQMKNIIKWAGPSATFTRRLASRIRHVTKDVVRDLRSEALAEEAKKQFSPLAPDRKLAGIKTIAKDVLRQRGFTIDTGIDGDMNDVIVADRGSATSGKLVLVFAYSALLKKRLEKMEYASNMHGLSYKTRLAAEKYKESMETHIICCALRNVPLSRIEDALPSFRADSSEIRVYSAGGRQPMKAAVHIHILDSLDSWPITKSRLIAHLDFVDGT